MRVRLKGVHTVKTRRKTYYYAWRGGPRLRGEPGSSEFHASFNEAVESRRTPDPGRFKSLVVASGRAPTMPGWPIAPNGFGPAGWTASQRILVHFALLSLTVRKKFARSFAVGAINGRISPARQITQYKCSRARALSRG